MCSIGCLRKFTAPHYILQNVSMLARYQSMADFFAD